MFNMDSRHLLNLSVQNALDFISENFNLNFPGEACARNSLEKCAAVLMGAIARILSLYIISLGPLYRKILRPPLWACSQDIRIDSLLVHISSSGISSTSVIWCPGWLRCCGTASSVLFCIALRCSTISNLSLKARLVCPMYSAGVFGVLLHLRHCITFW